MNKPWRYKQSVVGGTREVSRFRIPERSTSTSGPINKTRINPYFVLTSRGTTLILLPFAVSTLLGNPLDRGSNQYSFTDCDNIWDCCTSQNPCGLNSGDCDLNDHCMNDLVCGIANCGEGYPSNADCCVTSGTYNSSLTLV